MPEVVPPAYLGVWRRESLKLAGQDWDFSTRVHWLQTARWHADLRVPADRPAFDGVDSLAGCSEAQLDALLRQECFCGVTEVQGDVCRWRRQLDLQLRESEDIGRMVFDGDVVEEYGIGFELYERWRRLPRSTGRSLALQGRAPDARGDSACAFLLVTGAYFLYVRNRALWTAPAVRARHAIANGSASRAEREAWLDFEGSFGLIEDGVARIALSTLPWLEGREAFTLVSLEDAEPLVRAQAGWRWSALA